MASKPLSSTPVVPPAAGPPAAARSCLGALTASKIALIIGAVALVAVALGVGLGLGLRRASNFPTLSLPKLQPPVVASTPAGFRSARLLASRSLQVPSSPLQTIKSRLFSAGPTDFSARIAKIDERLAEFATRSAEFQRKCLSATPVAWTPAGLPGGISFPMSFQCREALGGPGGLTLFFGVGADNFAYVAELQNADSSSSSAPRMAVLAKAPLDGSAVEVIQVMDVSTASGPSRTSWLLISANKTALTMEISVAATAAGVGVGCGVRLRSASSLIWAAGEFADPFAPNPCSGTITSVCATGGTLAAAPGGTTDCTASAAPPMSAFTSSITPALTAAAINSTATWQVADGIIRAAGLPAVESFNTAA
jgi:hypothetical protein